MLSFLGLHFVGLILGGAIAGAFLAWKGRDLRLMLLAAIGTDLALLIGGAVVLMSFGVLAYDATDRPTLRELAEFYFVFLCGFAAAGATLSVGTACRLLSPQRGIKAFSAGGSIGGAVIVASEIMNVATGMVVFFALLISIVLAGALSGLSLNSTEEISLSILEPPHLIGSKPPDADVSRQFSLISRSR